MAIFDAWLYPQLRTLPEHERRAALRRAREDTPFDSLELVASAIGLIAVAAITGDGLTALEWLDRLGAIAVNFMAAFALLALLVGPFFVRRVRRGLQRELDGRGRP